MNSKGIDVSPINSLELVKLLLELNPVFILRDGRYTNNFIKSDKEHNINLENLYRNVNDSEGYSFTTLSSEDDFLNQTNTENNDFSGIFKTLDLLGVTPNLREQNNNADSVKVSNLNQNLANNNDSRYLSKTSYQNVPNRCEKICSFKNCNLKSKGQNHELSPNDNALFASLKKNKRNSIVITGYEEKNLKSKYKSRFEFNNHKNFDKNNKSNSNNNISSNNSHITSTDGILNHSSFIKREPYVEKYGSPLKYYLKHIVREYHVGKSGNSFKNNLKNFKTLESSQNSDSKTKVTNPNISNNQSSSKDIDNNGIQDKNQNGVVGALDNEKFKNLTEILTRVFVGNLKSDGSIITQSNVEESVATLRLLLSHYFALGTGVNFSNQGNSNKSSKRNLHEIVTRPIPNGSLSSLHELIKSAEPKKVQRLLAYIAYSFVNFSSAFVYSKYAHPIIVFEDIDSRLHPIELFAFWNLVSLLPVQQIITTNSGDMLSSVSLSDIRRMCATNLETRTFFINEDEFTSDELRKIAFHIRINRPMSLFARAWIFVEGETEIWLLNEFANILGLNLSASGVRLVEYAQCGATALIKLAKQLGIKWYLLADGDIAGQKYVNSSSKASNNDNVTMLPASDIEHFLYENGFEQIYRNNSGFGNTLGISESKIIERALKKYTKPGMAVQIVDYASKQGPCSVPTLIADILKRVIKDVTVDYFNDSALLK